MYLDQTQEQKTLLITALHTMRNTLKKAAMKVKKVKTKTKKKKKSILLNLTDEQMALFKGV
jgi:hypothetical protein